MNKLFLFFCTLLLTGCQSESKIYIEDRGEIFHTTYSIKYKYGRSLKNEIEASLLQFDNSLNPFNTSSVISKINKNEPVALDTLFIRVFNKSQELSMLSDGLFDITVSPLINAWGFGFKNSEKITPALIDSLKLLVGYEKIRLVNGVIEKANPNVQINTSAIAKGYSVDVIASLLQSYGIDDYMIEIGGEISAKGVNNKGECWHIGIERPDDVRSLFSNDYQSIVQLCNKSIATSGSYNNFYVKDGKRYAHTIDPRTGYPSQTNILSATVIAKDCMSADAYATVFMMTDTVQTRKIALQQGLSYLLIVATKDSSHIAITSADFENYILE
ncbi:MAG: hypothetical protein RL662_1802 [Bacteroidota bacterium]|jgi:thiamine biosynthesis lipoprotein